MNQLINMITRLLMRKLVSKGIDAGFNKASQLGRGQEMPAGEIDDFGNPVKTQKQVRAERRARRQAQGQSGNGGQQAKQAMKVMRRTSRF
ncbi:hypothetical protein C1J03_09355 [Sulfitobacter sp. SK012]|uniref:hypothetical protein n=1 Tax=Sulfitobacter sp. SK012 TaxID=1389005 RepID=UPI000E0CA510|nr:hypothetical protein [Sulfitobacter sp. SK012]AXI46210.1 hypothetical protein C1J03_09355 [Sulfitobacter sp. SK012]